MLDLEAANALLDVVNRTGASVAVVGDQHQALPVGHSGAMALFWRRAARQIELLKIHRFKDPAWGDLSLKVRKPQGAESAKRVAEELVTTGHVVLANDEAQARDAMADAWFRATRERQTIALVTATHAEAQAVSEDIQARRIAAGTVDVRKSVSGQSAQTIFVGDVVQTRRNDSATDVQNRQNWVVRSVFAEQVMLASANDSTDLRVISHEYARSHLHLAYATTVYGVQGETTDLAVVGPGVDAAGFYVGMTRGRKNNEAIVVASNRPSAIEQLVETMERRPVEETIEKSRIAARVELNRAAQSIVGPVGTPSQQHASGPALS